MSREFPLCNKKIFIWAGGQLGIECLQLIWRWRRVVCPELEIAGVCLSSSDATAISIEDFCLEHDITLLDESLPLPEKYDLGLCLGFNESFDPDLVNYFDHGILKIHLGLLPYYRGADSLAWSIINQESAVGVTLHYLDEGLDTGPIVTTQSMPLPRTVSTVEMLPKLELLAVETFQAWWSKMMSIPVLPAVFQNQLIERDHIQPKLYATAQLPAAYHLQADWPLAKIDRYVRALTTDRPERPYFEFDQRRIYLSLE
jgi:methionyl-tRNA formyltransferase